VARETCGNSDVIGQYGKKKFPLFFNSMANFVHNAANRTSKFLQYVLVVCGGDDDLMDTWHLEMRNTPCTMEKTLAHEGKAFGGSTTSSYCSTTCQKCQDITLEGVDVTF
jgi:hypothetical protein